MSHRLRTWMGAVCVLGLVGAVPASAASALGSGYDPVAPPSVRINEVHYDDADGDENETVEVLAPAGTDLGSWTIVLYNGSNRLAYKTYPLSGVVADQGGGIGVVGVGTPGIQNGAPDAIALVNPAGTVVEFLSYEGAFVAADGPAVGVTSTDIGVSETGSTLPSQSLQRGNDGTWRGPVCSSFGELNEPDAPVLCPVPPAEVTIHEIQGGGDASTLVGHRVVIEGVVVGDEEGAAPALRGFFVQEEDTDIDGDPATSEGIFVFNGDNDDVSLGDVVRVEGTVEERFGNTQLGSSVDVIVLDVQPRTASPAQIAFPLPVAGDFEAYEGMVATLPQTLVIADYFNYDRYGDVVVALPAPGEDRPYTPTALFEPDSQEARDRLDLNLRSRITIDDGISTQNPSAPVHPINRRLFSQDNGFRGGDRVSGLTGPIYYSFNLFRILPYAEGGYATYEQTQRDEAPAEVGGDVRVAVLNALNYFVSLDTADTCGPTQDQDCRGADDAGEFVRQRVKLLNALVGLDADVIGLVEVENTPGVEPLADIVAGLNERLGAGTYDYIVAGENSVVGTDAIKVGIVYRPAAVTPTGDVAVLDTPEFLNPNGYVNADGTSADKNRAAVASSFIDNKTGEVFSVAVNHLKSKGSECGAPDDHPMAGSCNDTRTKAAELLADWIEGDPTGVDDDDWLVIGDLNSYDKEAPIDALKASGFTDVIARYGGELAYSYLFDGQFGYLDHILSSSTMTSQVTGATEWHINSDEPDVLDYDTGFKSAYQAGLFDPTTPFRTSDHDAAIVGLTLDSFDADLLVLPGTLWPPNHKLRTVLVLATDYRNLIPSSVASVTSSEADAGLGRDDLPNDIQIVTDTAVQLRAERFSLAGRTYTITVKMQSTGQVRFDTETVFVPHSQRRS